MFHLALSKDKKFWNKSSTNLYLGPWAMPEILKKDFAEFDFIFPKWHWDNLEKFSSDNEIILNFYEKNFSKLCSALNEIHKLNWNERAWKILIGPWFRRFITVIYDRSETISILYKTYNLRSCYINENVSLKDLHTRDFDDFCNKYKYDDYNNLIYEFILKKIGKEEKIKFKKIKTNKFNIKNLEDKKKFTLKGLIKKIIFNNLFNSLFKKKIRKNKFYIHGLDLQNRLDVLKLNLKLSNFPHIRPLSIKCKDTKSFDKNLRIELINKINKNFKIDKNDYFTNVLIELFYYMFPRIYLENFETNNQFSKNIFEYYYPDTIIDSSSYHKDELFKFWTAKKIQKGVKFIILQHGGYYENFKIKEDFIGHELNIVDKYLSWGWKKKGYKIKPVACSKPFNYKNTKKDDKIINLILRPVGEYLNNLSTQNNPGENAETYINDIVGIANSINQNKVLRIFIHPTDNSKLEHGFSMKPYLDKKIKHPNKIFFYGNSYKYINDTNFNIFAYLGTPYNQAMSNNIPGILFHNKKYEPLNPDYKFVYDNMKQSNLMHDNINSLKIHLENIDRAFLDWWQKNETISAKNSFCQNFSRQNYSLDELKEAIIN